MYEKVLECITSPVEWKESRPKYIKEDKVEGTTDVSRITVMAISKKKKDAWWTMK